MHSFSGRYILTASFALAVAMTTCAAEPDSAAAAKQATAIESALARAGENRDNIHKALDANDHTTAILKRGERYAAQIEVGSASWKEAFRAGDAKNGPITWIVSERPAAPETSPPVATETIAALKTYLATPAAERPKLDEQPFSALSENHAYLRRPF